MQWKMEDKKTRSHGIRKISVLPQMLCLLSLLFVTSCDQLFYLASGWSICYKSKKKNTQGNLWKIRSCVPVYQQPINHPFRSTLISRLLVPDGSLLSTPVANSKGSAEHLLNNSPLLSSFLLMWFYSVLCV